MTVIRRANRTSRWLVNRVRNMNRLRTMTRSPGPARAPSPVVATSVACVLLISILAIAGGAAPSVAGSKRPALSGDLLGIHLGMEEHVARTRLLRLGTPVTSVDAPKQTWNLRDRRYGSLTIRYDGAGRVMWMTVFARPGGARVRYRDIGDLDQAHRGGSYVFTWTPPISPSGVPRSITARGPDPVYLSSVSIHPPGPGAAVPDSTTAD